MVTGLIFVAYKHPRGYRKLYLPLMGIAGAVWILHMVYSIGYSSGFSAALIGVYKLNKDAPVLTLSQETEPMWVGLCSDSGHRLSCVPPGAAVDSRSRWQTGQAMIHAI